MNNYSIPRHIWRVVWPALLFLGIQFAAGLTISTIVSVSRGDPLAGANYAAENPLVILLVCFSAALVVFATLWFKTKKTHPELNDGKLKAVFIVLALIMFAGYSLLVSSLLANTTIIEHFPSIEQVAANLQGAFVLQIIVIGLLAPFTEEFLVRGLILNRLNAWTPTWVAVLVSSLIFGLLHMNMFQFINTTILGLLFGFVYIRTKNLLIPILAHIANNMTGVILGQILKTTGAEEVPFMPLAIPGAVAAVICAVMIYRFSKPASIAESNPAETITGD